MGAALLVPHQDVFQPAPGFGLVQLVVDGQDRAARVAENVVNAMAAQGIHQGVGPCDPQRCRSGGLPHCLGRLSEGWGDRGLGRRSKGRERHGCSRPGFWPL